ncbi:MAG: class I SAM-dependent methyltransferase [Thermoanaerobaculia bacterium]
MSSLQSLYHAVVPPPIRYPIGRWRRRLVDQALRWRIPGPLPPRRLLTRIQETPYIREYLEVGAKSAEAIRSTLKDLGSAGEPAPKVLDFGCGLGRTLRFLAATGWRLHGCDVVSETLDWSRQALPGIRFELSSPAPPLPYPAASFDAVYAVSVFTHFDAGEQSSWAAELARVSKAGGVALISTMGPRAFSCYPVLAEHHRRFERDGFYLYRGDAEAEARSSSLTARPAFSVRGAFHTPEGLQRFFSGGWTLESYADGGLDGFQDLAVLRRS